MVEEVIQIISEIDSQIASDPTFESSRRAKIGMYLEIVKESMSNQHDLIDSYEAITKKLEAQIHECQSAIDESTQREMEQLEMIMQLKEQYDAFKADDDGDSDEEDNCQVCNRYEEENGIIRETVEQQEVVIEKLSKAQELLMLQYKIMEMGLNKELLSIQKTQMEIKEMQGEVAGLKAEEQQNEEKEEGAEN